MLRLICTLISILLISQCLGVIQIEQKAYVFKGNPYDPEDLSPFDVTEFALNPMDSNTSVGAIAYVPVPTVLFYSIH